MLPHELEAVIQNCPVAYLPLGTFEHHGRHMPVGNDAIKAEALCRLIAQKVGGAVLPPLYYGIGGGHIGFDWTVMAEEEWVRPILTRTLEHLARFGFKVIVMLTGHYPGEQTKMVKEAAREVESRVKGVRILGLPEYEAYTPQVGDHAAKWETSILMALSPELVDMSRLGAKPASPSPNGFHNSDPADPLYAIAGDDPRFYASEELGRKTVDEIVRTLSGQIKDALKTVIEGSAQIDVR